MNHIQLRRIALSLASLTFCILLILCLILSSVFSIGADGGAADAPLQVRGFEAVENCISLPYSISCTPLKVCSLSAYDGCFMEDGSGREVMDVAAILLYNDSDEMVPFASVTVYTENCQYTFEGFMLPAKSSVLIPDVNGEKLYNTQIRRIFGWITVKQNKRMPQIDVTETENNALLLQNTSGSRVHNLVLYHRTYIADGAFYVGGNVFESLVEEIPPGECVKYYPENYAAGYSRVVAIETN